MVTVLKIYVGNEPILASEVVQEINKAGIEIYPPIIRKREVSLTPEIIIALGSAGAFTALYQIISKFFEKNKDREITIEHEGTKITIKGHSLPEEKELFKKLALDFMED
ncbi:hypothetical protein K8R14_02685 [bacterium]|nr:hypothetical protein [bacterium]